VSLPTQLPVDSYGCEHESKGVREKEADEEFGHKKEKVTGLNNTNDQLDVTITILLIFESAQHVSGNLLPIFRTVRLWFTAMWCIVQCCSRMEVGGAAIFFFHPEDGQKISRNMLS
jgi:hypothetical protein